MNTKNIITVLFSILLLNGIFGATNSNYDSMNLVADTYNYSPVPVVPGEEFELWIQLTNNSNFEADNVTYFLDTKYPFQVSDFNNTELVLAKLAPYQTTIIKYKLTADIKTLDGTYEIDFKFRPGLTQTYNVKKYSIDVASDTSVLEVISTNLSDMSIGSDGNLELTIKNLSSKNVRDVFITLEDATGDFISVLDLKTRYFTSINAGEELKVNYKLNVAKTITQNSYALPLTIKFTNSAGIQTITRDIGVKINDNPKLVLNLTIVGENSNNKIYTNNKEKIEMEIYNVGNIDAESVYAEMTSAITNDSPKYFVGSIEKDNYDSIVLEFNTKADVKPGNYPVQVIVHYKDASLKEQTITKGINVEVTKNPNEKAAIASIFSVIIGIVIGIVVLAILVLFLRWAYRVLLLPAFGGIFTKIFNKKKK
ncbi:MAG: hypothetical protein WCX82_04085 [archaeon]